MTQLADNLARHLLLFQIRASSFGIVSQKSFLSDLKKETPLGTAEKNKKEKALTTNLKRRSVMDIGSLLKGKTEGLKEKAEELKGAAGEKFDQMVKEFNEAIPTLKGLGLSMRDFRMGMGVIPEIRTKMVGQLKDMDSEKIAELMEKYQDKKLLSSILKGLTTALNIKSMFGNLPFQGIELDVTLGMPPNLSINFLE